MSQATAPVPESVESQESEEREEVTLEMLMEAAEASILAAEEAERESVVAKGIELIFPFLRTGVRSLSK